MSQYLLRLIPPRPKFNEDMSDFEKGVMDQHAIYCKELIDKNIAMIFGPVFDPEGVWGLGIIEAEDEASARSIALQDPSVLSMVNKVEIYPMRVSMIRE